LILVGVAASSLAAAAGATGSPTLRQSATVEYRGFRFFPGSCDSRPSSCARSIAKDWTSTEIDIVSSAIDEIMDRTGGVSVIERTQQRGVTVLRRYGVFIGRSGAVPAAAALRRDPAPAAIEVYDSFFTSPEARDSHSRKPGFLLVSEILLHECMHAIDNVSGEAEFLNVAGFVRAKDKWQFAIHSTDEAAALIRFNQDFARLEAAGDFKGEWRLGRATAMNMRPIRVPTIQATARPAEAFAEIGAILILDPGARKYLPHALVAYFDRAVFHQPITAP